MQLIRQGAEAKLYMTEGMEYFGVDLPTPLIVKERISKRYRVQELDLRIVLSRTIHEAKLLHEAKVAGVSTPTLYFIDKVSHSLVMEYVVGPTLKEALQEDGVKNCHLLDDVGAIVAKLHERGIVHGDLTTSNMILSEGEITLIDFGLGEMSPDIEKQAVDLHLLKQALKSTHYQYWHHYWERVKTTYCRIRSNGEDVFDRIDDIELRGRYVQRGD